jgi:hypothetical protein
MREVAMKHATTTQNASCQSRERAALASLNTNSLQETSPAIDGRPSHVESQSLKTSDCVRVAVPGSGSPSRKRRLSTANEKESTSFSALHKNGKLKSTRGLKRKCSSSGLSRPFLPCPPAIQSVSKNPAGDVTSVQDCTEGSYPIPETNTHRSVRHTGADADSVQGDIPELGMEQQPLAMTLAQGTSPSLIVILKLSLLKAPQIRRDRKRLALALLSGIKTDAQTRNTSKDTFALIDSIRKADSLRLRKTLADAFDPYMEVLDQWFECVNIVHDFQDATNFYGDQHTWARHLDGLENMSRSTAIRHLLQAGIAMDDWISKQQTDFTVHSFSADLADALISMADWMGSINSGMSYSFKEEISQFNGNMLGWFSRSD